MVGWYCLFLLLRPRPARSTLFPYTTLFRSLDIPAIDADWYVGNCHKWLMAPKGSGFLWASPARRADTHPLVINHLDRKSTRLNSSHITISYAVFCLKKKKQKTKYHIETAPH